MIAAFDRDQGGDRYTAKVREAVTRAKDGRAELESGQDWNEQQRQAERQRGRGCMNMGRCPVPCGQETTLFKRISTVAPSAAAVIFNDFRVMFDPRRSMRCTDW